MSAVSDLAKFYFKYWDANRQFADNGPIEMRRWMAKLPDGMDREDVYHALAVLAGSPRDRTITPLEWIARRPTMAAVADSVLASRQPPKTFAELMERTYSSAQADDIDVTRAFLKAQLAAF